MGFFHLQQTALWTHCDTSPPGHGEATQGNVTIRLAFKKDPHLWLHGGKMEGRDGNQEVSQVAAGQKEGQGRDEWPHFARGKLRPRRSSRSDYSL